MSPVLIKCPCCTKMVPENHVDLVYRLPDVIACMDEDQIKKPPIVGLLANCVHLNTGVEDAEITVQLTGPKTSPVITIQDINCSLYNEQQSGITIHRVSEYSDLYR